MGQEWPQGYTVFRDRAKRAFAKGSSETDPQKIRELIQRGQFVMKEIEALYMLKKYKQGARFARPLLRPNRLSPITYIPTCLIHCIHINFHICCTCTIAIANRAAGL